MHRPELRQTLVSAASYDQAEGLQGLRLLTVFWQSSLQNQMFLHRPHLAVAGTWHSAHSCADSALAILRSASA